MRRYRPQRQFHSQLAEAIQCPRAQITHTTRSTQRAHRHAQAAIRSAVLRYAYRLQRQRQPLRQPVELLKADERGELNVQITARGNGAVVDCCRRRWNFDPLSTENAEVDLTYRGVCD